MKNRFRLMRPAFSLPEVVVALGVVLMLVGLFLPALSNSARNARDTLCLAQTHQNMGAIAAYADDHRGVWPYPMLPDGSGGWDVLIAGERYDAPFQTAYDWGGVFGAVSYWYLAVEGHAGPAFVNTLVCPYNRLPTGEKPMYTIDHTPLLQSRRELSWSLMYTPSYLSEHRLAFDMKTDFRLTRMDDVLFPSSKGVLVELPIHVPGYDGYRYEGEVGPEWAQTLGAADGSVRRLDAHVDGRPGVAAPPHPLPTDGDAETQGFVLTFRTTRDGVRGRDW